ncbi:hypothetical protein BU202_07925 [Streptococcus cuniculi]|uniref:Gram-positive cocci surface proteins LPxTG domain-containing protein n=1 Tax=Streptococcus cuniculi TaxID=1432788 RepID=A0A1Q8E631_9STRE|nr:Cna B-type domain-containing protein [Streptococcus cuniculi]OLF47247.1 hypothetical protein BU202_07925 [Streptococcus cuniculi]
MKKRWAGLLLSLLMVLSTLFQGLSNTVFAEGTEKQVTTTITNLKILNLNKEETDSIFHSDNFYLSMDWDASGNGADLKQGDYFTATLPDQMKFPSDSSAVDFNLYAPDGTSIMATAHVTPHANGGGTVKVTFTNWVENKYNVKGSMMLAASFNEDKITQGKRNIFTVAVNGGVTSQTVGVEVTGTTDLQDEFVTKWGWKNTSNHYQANWEGRINHMKATVSNAIISDTLVGTKEKFIPESIVLKKVVMDSKGKVQRELETVDLSGKLKMSDDNQTFTIQLGNINGEQYIIGYTSTYTPGTKLNNKISLISTEREASFVASYQSAESGGNGAGDLANKIKIIKVDADNAETKLANAKFKITRVSDGQEYEITTNAEGEAVTEKLIAGDYKIKELSAPNGFELNSEETTVTVSDGVAVIQTIKNEPIRTSVSVEKKWIGPLQDSVTVRLYADDEDTGKTTSLNAANGWKATFDHLRKFKADGTEIKYTVKEDVPAGYEDKVTGSQAGGYIITNTNVEKISIPVTKAWVGEKAGSVTVKLLADKKDTGQTLTLTEENRWQGNFTELLKYDATDGHEIDYTIEEVKIDGYTSVISGNVENGFTITNTITGKVSIPVTKTWVGKEGASAKLHLYADGEEVSSVVLNQNNHWQHTFTDFEKYKDGKEIQYTIKEEPIENYKSEVTGDMASGFRVKNTNIEKVSVPVVKQWVGTPTDQVEVKLLADGVEKASATLTAATDWKHTFNDLPKYDEQDGHEIVYTIEEVKVDGYTTGISGTAKDGFTITNTITGKVSIPVTKTWVGKEGASAKIHLYADGEEVSSVVLNQDNHWQHTFTDFEKYKDGKEIQYTIKEEPIENYKSEVTGDMTSGFRVKNINIEKVSVPVVKQWVGTPTDQVEVKLLADGVEKASATLTAATDWKHTFNDLPKYDEQDGKEIQYTIKEEPIENYKSEVTGDMASGFRVKNTNIEKVSVPVVKQWVGTPTDQVEVKLLADGVEKASATLTAATDWKHTFNDLPKYDEQDGHEIVYTIEEVKVDGYTTGISGTAKDGFTITNTIAGKVSIPVTKKWVGDPTDGIIVNLYADGKKVASQTLSKRNNWQYTFTNLEQYHNGKEISYTIEEEKLSGYSSVITGDAKRGFVITNTKDTPPAPKNNLPKTGDRANLLVYVGLLLGSVSLLLLLGTRRRKNGK